MSEGARMLLVEGCDFESAPRGGQLTFARQLAAVFGDKLALVGLAAGAGPVGRWTTKRIGRTEHRFLAVGGIVPGAERPFIPARLRVYCQLRRWKRAILEAGVKNVITIAPEALMAVHDWGWEHSCYVSSGVNNPLKMPRYRLAARFSAAFERQLFRYMADVDALMANADGRAIDELIARAGGVLDRRHVIQIPTFVDSQVFNRAAHVALGAAAYPPDRRPIVVASGRLNRVKGWDLVLDAFDRFARTSRRAMLVFVGDGEDRPALERRIAELNLTKHVQITGLVSQDQVAAHLAIADLVVLGSHLEGWPTAIVEAIACGKPVVSTDVSGARDLVREGANGFVVANRDPEAFADAMKRALELPSAFDVSIELSKEYSLEGMRQRFTAVCPALR